MPGDEGVESRGIEPHQLRIQDARGDAEVRCDADLVGAQIELVDIVADRVSHDPAAVLDHGDRASEAVELIAELVLVDKAQEENPEHEKSKENQRC